MGRRKDDEDYGLPRLTIAEAARFLGVREGALIYWVWEQLKPSSGRFGEWQSGKRPLPERLIRLYLSAHGGAGAKRVREEKPPPPAVVGPPRVAREPRARPGAKRAG